MALINQRIMRAETQYEDFIGTVAADFNADDSFVEFCRAVDIDINQSDSDSIAVMGNSIRQFIVKICMKRNHILSN